MPSSTVILAPWAAMRPANVESSAERLDISATTSASESIAEGFVLLRIEEIYVWRLATETPRALLSS